MTRLDGADLSHYQYNLAPIDWPTLRASTWWVAAKATQGVSYVDPTFAKSWSEMAVGFTHRLAYHWLSPFVSPTQQAAHFLSAVPAPFAGGVMLDAEEGGITAGNVLEWCEAVEAVTHRPCAVYCGAYTAGGTIWQSTRIRTSKYGPRPMHLAAYTSEQVALGLPGVKAYPWSAWQYSSNGPVPGVTGRCDMNRVDNRAAYDLACGVTAQPQPIGDDDMKIAINRDARMMPYGLAPPLTAVFVIGDFKRNIGREELDALYPGASPSPLSNVALDVIPDYAPPVAPGPPVPATYTINLTGTATP